MTTHKKSEQWLDDMIARAINAPPADFDPQRWHHKYAAQLNSVGWHGQAEGLTMKNKPQSHSIKRFLMKSHTTRIAASILVVTGIAAIIYSFATPDRGGIAWAQVAQQVQQARSFSYRVDTDMTTTSEKIPYMKGYSIVKFAADYGMKTQSFMNGQIAQEMYYTPQADSALILMPTAKKFMRMEFNEETIQKMKKQCWDPRELFSRLQNCQYTSIGRDTIDGVEVEGIESTDPKIFYSMFDNIHAKCWSDIRNGWPVRMEMTCTTDGGLKKMNMVASNYQWDIDIDPAEFQVDIPADYSELPKVKMPALSTDTAVAGLKKFVDLTGRYPKSLSVMNLMQEAEKVNLKNSDAPDPKDETEQMNMIMKEVMPIMFLGKFHGQLVQQNKDPKYYGDTVTPDDTNAVLLRWKSADNEYTVIFGDLTTQKVSPDELAQLENAKN